MSGPAETVLGSYRLVERIGKGGMGEVYRAQHLKLGREAAVKILPINLAGEAEILTRFEREAACAASLEHPNIVAIWEYGEHNGAPYLVMPYIRSGTLKERLKQGGLSRGQILHYLTQMADALDYAHERGIVHRDVKPANMLLDSRNRLYLSDFGIAKALEGAEGLTRTGVGIGTPEYMAPEQAQGHTDARSDLYALGVILYQMLTGREPYSGSSAVEILMKHMQDPLPLTPLRSVMPRLPAAVEAVVRKALAKNPNERYQSGHALVEAFSEALEGRSSDGRGTGDLTQLRPLPGEPGPWDQPGGGSPPAWPVPAGQTPPGAWQQPPGATPPGSWSRPEGQSAYPPAGAPAPHGWPQPGTMTPPPTYGQPAGYLAGPQPTPLPAAAPAAPPARTTRMPLLIGGVLGALALLLLCGGIGAYALNRPDTKATSTVRAVATATTQAIAAATGTTGAIVTATANAPTATLVPPTATLVPPTATRPPPTQTPTIAVTATPVPPTARPGGAAVISVSPTAGPAGTKFIINGDGLKAGDTLTYAVAGPTGTTSSDTIQLAPTQTSFRLTLSSDEAAPGVYAVAFIASDGSTAGKVSFTVR